MTDKPIEDKSAVNGQYTRALKIALTVAVLINPTVSSGTLIKKPSLNELKIKANTGDAEAQFELGYAYWQGEVVEKDLKKAVRYLMLSADQCNSNAQNNLGFFYAYGIGVEKDLKKAVMYYALAADQLNCSAQNNLGFYYHNGLGVEKDFKKAIKYFTLAANQGSEAALGNLSRILSLNASTERSTSKESAESMVSTVEQYVFFLQGNHGLKRGMNKEGFSDTFFKNDKNVSLYDKFLSFEQNCLTLLDSIKKDGFMITCLTANDEIKESLGYAIDETPSYVRFYPQLNAYCFSEESVRYGDLLYSMLTEEKNEKYLTFSAFEKELKNIYDINKKSLKRLEADRISLQEKLKLSLSNNVSFLEEKFIANTEKLSSKIDEKEAQVMVRKNLNKKVLELTVLDMAVENQSEQVKRIEQELETLVLLKEGILTLIRDTAGDRNERFEKVTLFK